MRHLVSFLSLLLLVTIGTDTTPLHARTWTDTRGRKLEAEFVQYHPDTAKVTIKLASGSKTTIPLKTLSLIDRQFVKDQHERTVPDCEMITPWEALSWNDTLWQTISTLNKADLEGTITFAPRQPRVSCQLPTAEIRTPAHFQTAIVTLCSKTKAATERLKLPAEPPAIPLISHRALDQPIADIDGTFYLTTERYKINGAIFSLAITYDNHTGLAFLNPELCAKQAKETLGDTTVAYLPLYLSSVHLFATDNDTDKVRAAVHELAAPLCQKYGKFYQGAYQQNGTTANWNDGLHSLRVGEYSGLYWSRSSTDLQKILDDHQRADLERHRLEETIRVRDISNLFTPTK